MYMIALMFRQVWNLENYVKRNLQWDISQIYFGLRAFFENNELVVMEPLDSYLQSQLGWSVEVIQALSQVDLAVFGTVD